MKKVYLYIIIGIVAVALIVEAAVLFMNNEKEAISCEDSDSGQEYNVFGTVSYGEKSFKDVCLSGAKLKEYYCSDGVKSIIPDCEFGCGDGKCMEQIIPEQEPACIDGTQYSSCSETKPKYCANGTLIDKCSSCGCISNLTCNSTSNICFVLNQTNGTNNTNASGNLTLMPKAPSNLTAVVSFTSANLTWNDNSGNEQGFYVRRSLNPSTGFEVIANLSANTTAYSDTTLSPSRTYFYDVKAFNYFGNLTSDVLSLTTNIFVNFSLTQKTRLLDPVGDGFQHSPFIVQDSGTYFMYYCKNTLISGVNKSRIWRIESADGLTGWSNDRIAIEGNNITGDDDLSCSPGVTKDFAGMWHMYYLASNRNSSCIVSLYHANSSDGITWTKQGAINGISQNLTNCYMAPPTPLFIGGKIILYYVGENNALYRAESTDGYNFSSIIFVKTAPCLGRVAYYDSLYYYVCGENDAKNYGNPNQIWLSVSSSGISFNEGQQLMKSNSSDWDGNAMFNPFLFFESSTYFRVYYSGNSADDYSTRVWNANTSIGLRKYSFSIS